MEGYLQYLLIGSGWPRTKKESFSSICYLYGMKEGWGRDGCTQSIPLVTLSFQSSDEIYLLEVTGFHLFNKYIKYSLCARCRYNSRHRVHRSELNKNLCFALASVAHAGWNIILQPNGHRFDSQLGYLPMLHIRFLFRTHRIPGLGTQRRQLINISLSNQCFSAFLCLSKAMSPGWCSSVD